MKIKVTESIKFKEPSIEREHPIAKEGSGSGTQKLWRFKNEFGASVVKFSIGIGLGGSYGVEKGLWELAVIKFNGNEYRIICDTPITDDVIGYLTEEQVESYLKKIRSLK